MELILGGIVSVLVELIKKFFGTSGMTTLLTVIVLSIVAASLYQIFVAVGWWETVFKTLTIAGGVWAFVFRQLDK